jgi:hypothetical protein
VTKQSRLNSVSLVWIASSLRSLAMTKYRFAAKKDFSAGGVPDRIPTNVRR